MAKSKRPTSSAQRSRHPLAVLYARATLDPVIEIARTLSHDFAKRPHRYQEIPEHVSGVLEEFRTRLGTDPDWPSAAQRSEVFGSLMGAGFCAATVSLRTAAVTLVESGRGPSDDLLRSVFRDAAATSRAYFGTLDGPALAIAERRTASVFRSAVEVLRTEGVARAFGVAHAPGGDWPAAAEPDGEAAYLLETIDNSLRLRQAQPIITRHRFMLLQRAAHCGALTLDDLLDESGDWDTGRQLDDVMQASYRWERALQDLLFKLDVPRAWKDPAYRDALSQTEKSMLPPHPSGDVTLDGAELDPKSAALRRQLGFQTMTIDAICCCTGDLPCPQGSDYCGTNIGFTCDLFGCPSGTFAVNYCA